MWRESETIFEAEDFSKLKSDSISLVHLFAKWQDSRAPEIKPVVVGLVSKSQHDSEFKAGYWPGKVHTYFDLYVAGVWNVFRAARLLLLALVIKLSEILGDHESYIHYVSTANDIAEDMIASIPYHLTDNLQVFLNELTTSSEISDEGRTLGGLLLMHPLYVAYKTPFLPERVRDYMRTCLLWIGTNMGLGQATLLASVRI